MNYSILNELMKGRRTEDDEHNQQKKAKEALNDSKRRKTITKRKFEQSKN